MDYSEYLKSATNKGEKFDLVFLDPPYAKDVKDEVLKKVSRANILNPGAIVVCESDRDLFVEDENVYGLIFRKKYRLHYKHGFAPAFSPHPQKIPRAV